MVSNNRPCPTVPQPGLHETHQLWDTHFPCFLVSNAILSHCPTCFIDRYTKRKKERAVNTRIPPCISLPPILWDSGTKVHLSLENKAFSCPIFCPTVHLCPQKTGDSLPLMRSNHAL
jgi:hypothetical protein